MKITANKSVSAEYELFVDSKIGGEPELKERATSATPLSFIYGVGMMLPKFEENLYGLTIGDKFEFTITSDDAYGPYEDENIIDLDRAIFEVDGKVDENMIFEGNVVPLMDSEGHRFNAKVLSVTDSQVKVDLNHPLAGENLHFKGSILEVREASEDEISSLYGGGCGCGSGGCGSGDCGCGEGEDSKDDCCGGSCGCH